MSGRENCAPDLARIVAAFACERQTAHGLAPLARWFGKGEASFEESLAQLVWQRCAYGLAHRLTDEKLPFLPLKGWDVSLRLYPDPALRPMSDLDLWIAPEQLPRLATIMAELGYRLHKRGGYDNTWRHGRHGCTVETHFALHEPGRAGFAPGAMWERAEAWSWQGLALRRLRADDLWVYLAWHFAKHRPWQRRLLWLVDLHLLSDRLDWPQAEEAARRWRVLRAAEVALWELHRLGLATPAAAPPGRLSPLFRTPIDAVGMRGRLLPRLYSLWLVEGWRQRGRYLWTRH